MKDIFNLTKEEEVRIWDLLIPIGCKKDDKNIHRAKIKDGQLVEEPQELGRIGHCTS